MNDTRQTKVNQMGLQGAVSQVKMIYVSVKDSGINLPEVNDIGLSEGDCLFKLRKINAELMHENQVHRIVDVFMEPYATYRKERTMV